MNNDNLIRMKASRGDKLVELNCSTCEFNFGDVCAGHGTRIDNGQDVYGMSIKETMEMFSDGCDDYGISISAFIQQEKLNGR